MTPIENENQNIYKIKMHRWRMAFFALVILFAGILIGASAAFIVKLPWLNPPPPGPNQMANRMLRGLGHDLNLSPEQRMQIEPIIHQHMQRLDQIRNDARPLIEDEMRKMNDEILPLLDPQQKDRWLQMMRRLPLEPMPPQIGPPPHRPGK